MAKICMGLGLILICAGAAYALFVAGIPYQDPTPALQAKWERNHQIANWLMIAGLIIILVAGARAVLRWLQNRRPKSSRTTQCD